jgi:hypothetical protein
MSKISDADVQLITAREKIYGDPVATFSRIAQMWSAILDTDVQAWQVPLMMMAMKQIRATQAPDYADNINDIEGYAVIYRRLLGEDMIEAKTTEDYIAQMVARHD